MAQLKNQNEENSYKEAYPTVFKKIDQSDIKVNPFQANKTFRFLSGSATSSALPLTGIYSDVNVLPAIGSGLVYNDASNIDGSLQSVTYFSINHLYYKRKGEPANTFGPTDLNRTKKFLYETASVFSIPQIKIGEGIKPTSFTFTSSVSGSYHSDRYGNVLDSGIDVNSLISDVKFYEGFNEYFDTSRINYKTIGTGITYINGITTSNGRQLPMGLSAQFNKFGYIQTNLPGEYNRDSDYAISMFISGAADSVDDRIIITKASSSLTLFSDLEKESQYPFRLELSGSNQLKFSIQGSPTYRSMITSSAEVSSSWTHVVCQKTGSVMQMYIDGTLHNSTTSTLLENIQHPLSASARIDNPYDLCIGGLVDGQSRINYNGQLDEVRIYNKALNAVEVGYLADRTEGGTALQTNVVGNVFAKQGIVVFSSPDYRVDDLLNTPYTASYKSTVTIHELSAVARLDAGDFNMSMNVTLTKDNNQTYRGFVSGSDFSPYITTIGLYNEAGQLLAMGKLAQPIKKRSDVDMNFLIRLDLDKNIVK